MLQINAFSVDVEEHFQVLNFQKRLPASAWDGQESRVACNTRCVLELLEEAGVTATFFILGWVAARQPGLVREIAGAGHELASHGWSHAPLTRLDRAGFKEEAERSKKCLEDLAGGEVAGFRAPSFSVVSKTLWGLDILLDLGYRYDSSVFPIRHPDYGLPAARREIHHLMAPSGRPMVEFPMTVARFLGRPVPVSGGGYFRILPYRLTRWGFAQANREGRAAIFYMHPWEVDPKQPDLRRHTSRMGAFRHYTGLTRTLPRLKKLLQDFRFASCREVLQERGFL